MPQDAIISDIVSKLFAEMLNEIVMDCAMETFHGTSRARSICEVCNTRCGQAHRAAESSSTPARTPTPEHSLLPATNGHAPSGVNGLSQKPVDISVPLECVGCKRQIPANKYASHLASCMGLTRRGVARAASSKPKISQNSHETLPNDGDNISEEGKSSPSKGKAKGRTLPGSQEAINRKLPHSPQMTNGKTRKSSSSVGPPNSALNNGDSPTKNGQRLAPPHPQRRTSLASVPPIEPRSRSGSPASSTDTPIASASTPASMTGLSLQSPVLHAATITASSKMKTNAKTTPGPPVSGIHKPFTQPAHALHLGTAPAVNVARRIQDFDYLVDVEGEETGSSSDTDSG